MEIIYLLLPLSLLLAACGLAAYLWALRGRQFDDLETPGYRVLFDDQPVRPGVDETSTTASGSSPPAEPPAERRK